jgi:hypothetical protein
MSACDVEECKDVGSHMINDRRTLIPTVLQSAIPIGHTYKQ